MLVHYAPVICVEPKLNENAASFFVALEEGAAGKCLFAWDPFAVEVEDSAVDCPVFFAVVGYPHHKILSVLDTNVVLDFFLLPLILVLQGNTAETVVVVGRFFGLCAVRRGRFENFNLKLLRRTYCE
jgi:hypothetical protein